MAPCIATLGETVVLCAVTAAKTVKPGQDFFPLTVHYQEKYSAAGRIPGGFFKRERGATEKETLTSRLIDRPIRPLFPEGFYNEVLVIAQVLSYDGENEPDIVAMMRRVGRPTISGVPFMGPIGAARVGYVDGEYILNPNNTQVAEGDLDLVVAGTLDAVMMVESEANELSEDVMLGAVMFAHRRQRRRSCEGIIKLAEKAAKDPWELATSDAKTAAKAKLKSVVGKDIEAAYKLTDKAERVGRAQRRPRQGPPKPSPMPTPQEQIERVEGGQEASRPTSSAPRSSRKAAASTAATPRPFARSRRWSASCRAPTARRLFTRGETQAICTTTLGTKESEQMIDGLEGLTLLALHAPL